MSRESEKRIRDSLRKDVRGPYELPPLKSFHVEQTKRPLTEQEQWEMYMKAVEELRRRGLI